MFVESWPSSSPQLLVGCSPYASLDRDLPHRTIRRRKGNSYLPVCSLQSSTRRGNLELSYSGAFLPVPERRSTSSPGFNSYPAIFGFPEEWTEFANRRTEFLRRWPNLEKAAGAAFDRTERDTQLWRRVIYFQGRLVYEEFLEILLLCGNAYGIGAQRKILWGMYERAVTTRYLSTHNDKVDDYLAFHRVTDYKLLQSARTTLKTTVFQKEKADRIEQEYKTVREIYGDRLREAPFLARLPSAYSRVS